MITLTFAYPGQRLTLGPYDSLRFEGQAIRATAGGHVLAHHRAARWEAGGRAFYRAECDGPLMLRLDGCDAGERLVGPFEHFCVHNDTAYVGRHLFAWYYHNDVSSWQLLPGGDRCAALVIASAVTP